MAATTGYRTLYPALLPLGAAHVDLVMTSCRTRYNETTTLLGALLSSLLIDFQVRSTGIGSIRGSNIEALPRPSGNGLLDHLPKAVSKIYLRLNCLTSAYSLLWEEATGETWTVNTPIRNAQERFHAQNEIDAIIALLLGVTADELCLIYRTQFPVMRRYDQEDHFDSHGRKVPKEIMKLQEKIKEGEQLPKGQRTWVHPQSKVTYTFEYPFASLDREADLRRAYAQFSSE